MANGQRSWKQGYCVFWPTAVCLFLQVTVDVSRADQQITAKTNYGEILGLATSRARVFRGVPYAQPPIQGLRFKPPQEPIAWGPSLIRHALEDPPGCPQNCTGNLPEIACPPTINESCLFLNLFAPLIKPKTEEGYPVMVFIHGGNFRRGFCGGPLYDGQLLVNTTKVILVTINYRLGALGYLTHAASGIEGNFGIMDQRLALRWVQENIAYFDGNPNKVTLFGQSAGAISTAIHLSSPRSAGLFQQAIVESEPFGIYLRDTEDANRMADDFLKYLGCKGDQACIQQASIPRVLEADTKTARQLVNLDRLLEIFLPWTPTVDGIEVDKQPLASWQEGDIQDIPIIIGTVSEECVLYIYEVSPVKPITPAEYELALIAKFGTKGSSVKAIYPPQAGETDTRDVLSRLATDYCFVCPTRNCSRIISAQNKKPVWVYAFNHSWSFEGWGKYFPFCEHRVCHGSELPFVFNPYNLANLFNITAAEKTLATTINAYWTNFAHTGDPNEAPAFYGKASDMTLVPWPEYLALYSWRIMNLTTPACTVRENYLKTQCDFWDKFSYRD